MRSQERAPITIVAGDAQAAKEIAGLLDRAGHDTPAQSATIVTSEGRTLELDESLVAAMQALVSLLARGDDVALVPVHKELSTFEAATLLNVSRPFLIRLLDNGDIPHARVGNHRRIRFNDLLLFKQRQSEENRRNLAAALAIAQEAGAYD